MNSSSPSIRVEPPPLPPRQRDLNLTVQGVSYPNDALSPPSPSQYSPASTNDAPPLPPRPRPSNDITPTDIASGNTATPIPNVQVTDLSDATHGFKGEEELTEVQLREMYDDDEIERFLHLFSTYFNEVRASSPNLSPGRSRASPGPTSRFSDATSEAEDEDDEGAESFQVVEITAEPATQTPRVPRGLSERIAIDFLLPLLPPPRPPPPKFTLKRLKQSIQRLYVALEPVISKFEVPLFKLAIWENPRRSFVFCALYWTLWYHHKLLPALFLRLLYDLIQWKLHPYPSLEEFRAHRLRIEHSRTLGTALSTRLNATSSFGVHEALGLFNDYRHIRKERKAKKQAAAANEEPSGNADENADDAEWDVPTTGLTDTPDHGVAVDDESLKQLGLFLLNEFVDLVERIKNIFLWRQPSASLVYGSILFFFFCVSLLSARVLSMIFGAWLGFIFWHVIPVLAAIPPSERSRVPPPLSRVPTDAEYAMELISQRVARGLPVTPRSRKGKWSPSALLSPNDNEGTREQSLSSGVDWNKWGQRLGSAKERTEEVTSLFKDKRWKDVDNWKALQPSLTPRVVTPNGGEEPRIDTQTFPAQYKKHPGLITLSPTTLFFTPLLSSRPTLTVPLSTMTGVKKANVVKGLDVRYTDAEQGGGEAEAKFLFVGSRNDLFARLVSWGGRRWERV